MKIGRNVLFNLLGFFIPVAILFVSYPALLKGLGIAHFGILSLAMSLAAALTFLDFGLAAASLRFVVSDLHQGNFSAAGRVMTTSLSFFGSLGFAISICIFFMASRLTYWMDVPEVDRELARVVFRLTALQIGFGLLLNAVAGLFKALDRFDLSATVVILVALFTNAVPAWQIVGFGQSLPFVLTTSAWTLGIVSIGSIAVLNVVARSKGVRLVRSLPDVPTFRRTIAFGAALTLHGLIGMLFTHGQRLLVGVLFGPTAVAAYQLALTIVSKVHAAINAAAEVALPIASGGELERVRAAYLKGIGFLSIMSLFPLIFIGAFNEEIIQLWLGSSAPPLAAKLLPPLCFAYFFVAISSLPYHILNGLGRPNVNVIFAILNAVVYLLSLGGFYILGVQSVHSIAIAYAISNVVCGLLYQWFCVAALARPGGGWILGRSNAIAPR